MIRAYENPMVSLNNALGGVVYHLMTLEVSKPIHPIPNAPWEYLQTHEWLKFMVNVGTLQ